MMILASSCYVQAWCRATHQEGVKHQCRTTRSIGNQRGILGSIGAERRSREETGGIGREGSVED